MPSFHLDVITWVPFMLQALVAQLDAGPTGEQEASDLIPPCPATFL